MANPAVHLQVCRRGCVWLWLLLCVCYAPAARAQDNPQAALAEPKAAPLRLFQYTKPQAPNFLRAGVEEVLLLSIGFADYIAGRDINAPDWDIALSWGGLRDKLSPRGYSFDTNTFNTNFIRHPGAGTAYYWAARGNRLTVAESLIVAFVASTLWEYIGELRERASLNDIIATPLAGMVLGELTLQLGGFFDRSCDTAHNRILGSLFGPVKTVHDALDGAAPLREQRCDRYGLSQRGAHRFELSLGAGVLGTIAGPGSPLRSWTRLALHTEITAVETYGTIGAGIHHFSAANITELRLAGTFAGDAWNDFSLRATLMPFGLHSRSISADGGILSGRELLFGMLFSTEYAAHRFGVWQSASRQFDRYFELGALGVGIAQRYHYEGTQLTLEMQAYPVFLGIETFALPAARALPSRLPLPSVTEAQGYSYALGVRLQPRIRFTYRGFEAAIELASVRAGAIMVRDRFMDRPDYARGAERRTQAGVWLGLGPDAWPARIFVHSSLLHRAGSLGPARAARAELAVATGLYAVF